MILIYSTLLFIIFDKYLSIYSSMKRLLIVSILSIIAIVNAWYLTYKAYCISIDPAMQRGVCDINAQWSCSDVLAHPAAYIVGIPFPAIALLVYPLLFIIALLWYRGRIQWHWTALRYLSVWWILFNSYFIYQEAFTIGSYCPLCLLCSGLILTIAILSRYPHKTA